MHQLPFAYKPSNAGRQVWLAMLGALNAAVNHLGQKEVIFELDICISTLSEALNERPVRKKGDKRWANEWTLVVLAMLDARHTDTCDQLARDILEKQAALSSRFSIADKFDDLTPEEIAIFRRVADKVDKATKRRKSA